MSQVTLVDVSNTVNQPYTTGIQRVVREISRVAVGRGVLLVEFSSASGQWHLVDPRDLDQSRLGTGGRTNILRARELYHLAIRSAGNPEAAHLALRLMPTQAEKARRLLAGRRARFGDQIEVGGAHLILPEVTSSVRHADTVRDLATQGSLRLSCFVHDLFSLTNPEWFQFDPRHHFPQYLEAVGASSRIAVASEFVRNQLRSAGVEIESKTFPLPAGRTMPFDQRSAITAPEPYMLSVGSFEPRKNHVGLLAAVTQLAESGIQIRLVLVSQLRSGPPGFDAAVTRARASGAQVTILHDVDDAQLGHLYSGATCTVYPSFAEGYGLPVVESLAYGTPVITSDTSALREFANLGGVLLIEPSDTEALATAIRGVLDPHAQRALAAGIHANRVPVGWEPWAQRLLDWSSDGDRTTNTWSLERRKMGTAQRDRTR